MTIKLTRRQAMRFDCLFENAKQRALAEISHHLDRESLRHFFAQEKTFHERFLALLLQCSGNEHAHQEVVSTATYSPLYQLKPIDMQIGMLAEAFDLSRTYADAYVEKLFRTSKKPAGAEGVFAMVNPDALMRRFYPKVSGSRELYCLITKLMLARIGASREVENCLGDLSPCMFRQCHRSQWMHELLHEEQPGDIWVFWGQFGLRHRGRSSCRVNEVIERTYGQKLEEFPIGVFGSANLLLTHPERLSSTASLRVDCTADETSSLEGFWCTPSFSFFENKMRFNRVWHGDAKEYSASASAFLRVRYRRLPA